MSVILLQPSAGGPGYTPTTTRIPFAVGSTLTDDADLIFDSVTNTVGVGSGANGQLVGGAKLTLKSTGANNLELTPGTGLVDLTIGQLNIPAGSQGAPSIRLAGSNNMGWYTVAGLSVLTVGGGNVLILTSSSVNAGADLIGHSNDTYKLGLTTARFTDANIRHIQRNVRTVTADTTLDSTYQDVIVNSATGKTITLPTAASAFSSNQSREFCIKNTGVGTVTVAVTGGGTSEVTSILTGQSFTFRTDGTTWSTW